MNGLSEDWVLYIVAEGRLVGILQSIRTVRTVVFMIKDRDRKQI